MFKHIKWILLKSKGFRYAYFIIGFAGILIAVKNILTAYTLSNYINIATGTSHIDTITNTILFFLVVVLEIASSYMIKNNTAISMNKLSGKLRLEVANKLFRSKLEEIEQFHSEEYMVRISKDIEVVSGFIPQFINNVLTNGISAILATIYMFILSWKLASITIISIPLLLLVITRYSKKLQVVGKIDRENEETIRISMKEAFSHINILRLYGMKNHINEVLREKINLKTVSGKKLARKEWQVGTINNLMGSSMLAIAFVGGVILAAKGELLAGGMIAIIQLYNYIVWPFTASGSILAEVNQMSISLDRMNQVYEMPEHEEVLQADREQDKYAEKLEMIQVGYHYPTGNGIDNISLYSERGDITVIKGTSGSGKSTLLKILAGLYQPESGEYRITYMNGPQKVIDQPGKARISYIPADNYIIQGTIISNICMAKDLNWEKLKRCIHFANLDKEIESLSNGYNTIIGEGGLQLSSGQNQRIALARAFYHDADILLLDEPSSNLDLDSVVIMKDSIQEFARERICIITTHDERMMDIGNLILEMKDGKLYQC